MRWDKVDWIFIFIFIGIFIFFGFLSYETGKEKSRLLSMCMADGKKEYECHAMLDDHSQIVPVVVPVSR